MREAQFYTVVPGRTGCIDCNHLQQSRENPEYAGFIADFISSGFRAPSAGTAAGYMALTGIMGGELSRFLAQTGPLQSEEKVMSFHFEKLSCETRMIFTKQEEDCPTCGSGPRNAAIFQLLEHEGE